MNAFQILTIVLDIVVVGISARAVVSILRPVSQMRDGIDQWVADWDAATHRWDS